MSGNETRRSEASLPTPPTPRVQAAVIIQPAAQSRIPVAGRVSEDFSLLQKMKALVPTFILLAMVGSGCSGKRDEIVSEQKERVAATIQVGDDIHEAKSKLANLGFQIDYGPDFPTKNKDYLMMIVDYGVSRAGVETFKYTVELSDGSGKPIVGIVKATPDGVITSID